MSSLCGRPCRLEKLKLNYSDRLDIFNIAIGSENNNLDLYFGDEKSEKASLVPNLEKLSFVGNSNKNRVSVEVKKLDYMENYLKDQKVEIKLKWSIE